MLQYIFKIMEICSQQCGEFFLLLDISCQQLGDECKLGSFCAPFRAGDTFFKTYICVGNNQEIMTQNYLYFGTNVFSNECS